MRGAQRRRCGHRLLHLELHCTTVQCNVLVASLLPPGFITSGLIIVAVVQKLCLTLQQWLEARLFLQNGEAAHELAHIFHCRTGCSIRLKNLK